jgi:raffinose synthase
MIQPIEQILDLMSKSISIKESNKKEGAFIYIDHSSVIKGCEGQIKIKDLVRWVALARVDPYWSAPFFGTCESDLPEETQYLLWERGDGSYGILLPVIDGDLRTTLKGNEKGLAFIVNGAIKDEEPEIVFAAYVSTGSDPYELTCNSIKILSKKLGTFKIREDKYKPEFINYLGWCTWDAFKHDVDEEKVLEGLESFKKGGVQPGFMILDDGGLDTQGDYLNNFAVHPEKFPGGLKELVNTSKEKYGIKLFGMRI